ncbi:DUF1382 family protein [Enterovibrio norvegicus]|uniref:DUF1382 family protein n=1 Tax=Enterovibrio norvegicus TaxID=188144 RepID=UPI000C83E273|nr:DUF1382 family protein [Enterovibrio norvegicus]PMN68397.1 hypothetical protein BCT27_23635 [Enterovibrio norvegicus]
MAPQKQSPVEMRKSLVLVEELVRSGIEFVPVPVLDADHRVKLLEEFDASLNELLKRTLA